MPKKAVDYIEIDEVIAPGATPEKVNPSEEERFDKKGPFSFGGRGISKWMDRLNKIRGLSHSRIGKIILFLAGGLLLIVLLTFGVAALVLWLIWKFLRFLLSPFLGSSDNGVRGVHFQVKRF